MFGFFAGSESAPVTTFVETAGSIETTTTSTRFVESTFLRYCHLFVLNEHRPLKPAYFFVFIPPYRLGGIVNE
jgi:hypothetical protein